MEKKKKKWLIIGSVAGGVLLAGLIVFLVLHFRSPKVDDNPEEMSDTIAGEEDDETGPIHLKPDTYYMVVINHDTAFIVLDTVSEKGFSGFYYWLVEQSDCVSALPFEVSYHRRTTQLVFEGAELTFKIDAKQLENSLDGACHLIMTTEDKGYNFQIFRYKEPFFTIYSSSRYQKEIYPVQCYRDINYGRATGYWTSFTGNESDSYAKIVKEGLKNSLSSRELDLDMDLYLPEEGADTLIPNHSHRLRRPLVVFLHGGAYYVGDKSDQAIAQWCRHFAAMGYAAASINYRMGYLPSKKDIERAGYMAIQDAHAAMRYLVAKADDYLIDTNRLFVAGASAGSITALNLAFMRNRNRPDASFGKGGNPDKGKKKSTTETKESAKGSRGDDLGKIQSAGNDIDISFHIIGVANMWGAVNDLNILKNSHTAIVSFHGDADQLVPYDHGYPFSDISDKLGRRLFEQMFGSASIHKRAKELGLTSKLYTFPGAGHALHLNEDRTINKANFNFIRDSITDFFFHTMVPHPAHISADPVEIRHYYVDNPDIVQVLWKVEGGFVLQATDTDLWVVWKEEELDQRKISVSGFYLNTIPFYTTLSLSPE